MTMLRTTAILALLASTTLPLAAQRRAPATADGFTIELELPRRPAISQDQTGTCWSYATTSFFESELERIHHEAFDLSEMHTVYFAYLEKAKRYVRLHGKAQFSQGGLSHDLLPIVRAHGVVPSDAYSGLCRGQTAHDHGELESVLQPVLDKLAKSSSPSPHWEQAIRGILDAYLGPVPASVVAHGTEVTPQRYATEVLRLPIDDYVEVMSFSYTPFGERGELLVPDNWLRWQGYWNVPVDELLANLDHALKTGYTVAVDVDVSEPTNGAVVFRLSDALEKRTITDEMRQRMFDSRETTDDHLMHVVGTARDKDGKPHYLTKNSWGSSGPFAGHAMITRNYMAAKLLAFMVHRDALLPETRAKFEKTAQ